jgi:photosystem II stability/assembly factor-like uncharacterized protein
MFDALQWRMIGPHRGGRSVAVAGDPSQPLVFYFGACAGGMFKTTDGGASWRDVSEGAFAAGAVGALAVADADPDVLYAGMGESCIRANVSHGDGVYRSDDGGHHWRHLGLRDTRHIARVRVHPRDPDIVYVAAFGHAWGPNPDRGVFRSTDGGKTWKRILYLDERTGAIDLVLNPRNPKILYAALWEAQRTPYSLISGGPGSGIYRSSDGGDHWTCLSEHPGLPRGLKGRIGVAVSPAQPNRVWASIEADQSGIYRSEDGGDTWRHVGEAREQMQRPWYFMHIFADTIDPDTLYSLNLHAWKSIDGGSTFAEIPVAHPDTHDLWIDPRDPRRMIMGNDGGATVTFDAGLTWTTQYNQPTAQFYRVTTDTRFPYRVYGSQQDNTTVSLPHRSDRGAITRLDFYPVGGHESGYIAVRPDNPDIVFGGIFSNRITRYDHKTGQVQDVTVWPEDPIGWAAKDVRYRFNWTFPIVLSPHDPNVLYTAGNYVFVSENEGMSWTAISPDLTRNDATKLQPSGGPITPDNYCTEYYCTIYALAESPVERGVIWAGSDDGLIHLSRDGGRHWHNVTPSALPEWALVSTIEPSPHAGGGAYVAATRYKLDDPQPYLYKTEDYGRTWTSITRGIPADDLTRVIRADPLRRGLLYAGTETSVFVSFDDGDSWQSLRLNLPACPIYDLAVKDTDLVAGTHGRSFWILDDISPLRHWTDEVARQPVHLFPPTPAFRLRQPNWFVSGGASERKVYLSAMGDVVATAYARSLPDGTTKLEYLDAGENPPNGLVVTYYLREEPADAVTLSFVEEDGKTIKQFSSRHPGDGGSSEPSVTKHRGLNRFVWDLRYPDPIPLEEGKLFNYWARSARGPVAAPGSYRVVLGVNRATRERSFEIKQDPRVPSSTQDLRRQVALLLQIRDKIAEVHTTINSARRIRKRIAEWLARLDGKPAHKTIAQSLRRADAKLAGILDQLVQPEVRIGSDFAVYPPKLNSRLLALAAQIANSETAPTTQSFDVFSHLAQRADEHVNEFRAVTSNELSKLSEEIRAANMPAIAVEPSATDV